MFNTDVIQNAASTTGNTNLASVFNQSLDKDQFLQLLVAELRNQDPLSPMESKDFASQLAQFGSLEQLQNIQGTLTEGVGIDLVLTQAINNTMAASFIGKEVTAMGNGVRLEGVSNATVNYKLGGFAEEVTVKILDAAGNEVRTMTVKGVSGGKQTLSWDGTNNNGERLPTGDYRFVVEAKDTNGNAVTTTTMIVGMIDSVRYENGAAILVVNGTEINFSDVLEIGQGTYSNHEEEK